MFRSGFPILAVVGCLCSTQPLFPQQSSRAGPGGIAGVVVDAESLSPLSGALVTLESEGSSVLPGPEGSQFLGTGQSTVSNGNGEYRFDGLTAGRYRLRISLLGYRSTVLGVELRGSGESTVSVGLRVQPVSLEPIEIQGQPEAGYRGDAGIAGEIEGSRVMAARARQREHLLSDVREMTHADVIESVTLGETDLFRAFQRSPGVTARDDYGSELWVRGASWDQTRVRFDGIPLFNPVHAFGLLSALNTDAVGGALLHPGVRPASAGDGAAALLDVTTRSGSHAERLNGSADLSLASGRLALDGSLLGGRGAWLIGARRSWLDLVTATASHLVGDPQLELPFAFHDITGRFDLEMSGGEALEVSAMHERDRVHGTIPDLLHRTNGSWGNTVGRVTYEFPAAGYLSRTTVGFSRYEAIIREAETAPEEEGELSAPSQPSSDNGLTHVSLTGEVGPRMANAGSRPWAIGYGIVHERGAYDGPPGYAYNGYRPVDVDSVFQRSGSVTFGIAWADRRWEAKPGLTMDTGLRMELGPRIRNGGSVRVAPRLMVRYAPTGDLLFSAGAGRFYQYTQTLSGTGPELGPAYAASYIWLVAAKDAPAIRADVVTLGAELWIAGEWLLAANAYARRSTGITLSDPTPGLLIDRPLFVVGSNRARGLELSARRLAGRWTSSVSYSLSSSDMDAAGLTFPASEDRRHVADVTSMVRVGSSLRMGGAFTFFTGSPYTRIHWRSGECSDQPCDFELIAEPRNRHRSAAYASLDLLFDWTGEIRSWEVGAYIQLRNAFGRRNDVTFSDTRFTCTSFDPVNLGCSEEGFRDQFQQGIPTLPIVGFRVRF